MASSQVVIIGKTCKDVKRENAFDYVLGYTLANDVSARTRMFAVPQWGLGKCMRGWPCRVHGIDHVSTPSHRQIVRHLSTPRAMYCQCSVAAASRPRQRRPQDGRQWADDAAGQHARHALWLCRDNRVAQPGVSCAASNLSVWEPLTLILLGIAAPRSRQAPSSPCEFAVPPPISAMPLTPPSRPTGEHRPAKASNATRPSFSSTATFAQSRAPTAWAPSPTPSWMRQGAREDNRGCK